MENFEKHNLFVASCMYLRRSRSDQWRCYKLNSKRKLTSPNLVAGLAISVHIRRIIKWAPNSVCYLRARKAARVA